MALSEASQALAFILWYFSHGVGDRFAHTWVNDLAEEAWNIGAGGGIFGDVTEEFKHMAVEALVDERLPHAIVSLASAPGSSGNWH